MLDDTTRRQLQRLRFLLEEALARTHDATDVGRHTAVVLLDGACENAMGLALRRLELPGDRPGFYDRYSTLREHLPDWQPGTWSSIKLLHETRNQVQHHNVLPAGREITSWASHAQRFIESLVATAFDVELNSVLVADSVTTEAVRELLAEAERALTQEDADTAFDAAVAAFDTARGLWQDQRADALGPLTLPASSFRLPGDQEHDPTIRSLIRSEDLLEVQTFALDLGEYHWLLARRDEPEGTVRPLKDAQRAFRFVLAWTLRWEAFAARYEARRYPPEEPPYVPPVTGATQPRIYTVGVEVLHHLGHWLDEPGVENARYTVRVVLSDLPSVDRTIWAQQVGDVLEEMATAEAADRIGAARIDAGGVVRFHGVSTAVDASEILDWIDRAIDEGTKRARRRVEEQRERLDLLPTRTAELTAALSAVDTTRLVEEVFAAERGESMWMGVRLRSPEGDPMLLHLLGRAISRHRSNLQGLEVEHLTLWFPMMSDARDAARLVSLVAEQFRADAASRREGLAAVENHRKSLEDGLRSVAVISGTDSALKPS